MSAIDELLDAYDIAVVEYDEATKAAYWYNPFSYLTVAEKRKAYEAAKNRVARRMAP